MPAEMKALKSFRKIESYELPKVFSSQRRPTEAIGSLEERLSKVSGRGHPLARLVVDKK